MVVLIQIYVFHIQFTICTLALFIEQVGNSKKDITDHCNCTSQIPANAGYRAHSSGGGHGFDQYLGRQCNNNAIVIYGILSNRSTTVRVVKCVLHNKQYVKTYYLYNLLPALRFTNIFQIVLKYCQIPGFSLPIRG